ncbi:MAG TPA: helix-turn-helix domain-containing protein [Vicinamibacterales bacterium]|nr:helix-turn-helix domain-containing protein [Vicinamibacterales bacterium]
MPVRATAKRRSACPINVALEVFGDHWSLLIVRDLLFKGRHTFADFAGAEESIATNVLTDRLTKLERDGIIRRRPDPADRRRVRYELTDKGLDLAPVLVEMILWSARYERTAATPAEVREMTKRKARFIAAAQASSRTSASR